VINELLNPQTIDGARYDTLVAAENNNLLDMLFWENTVRYLRHYHERFIAGNAHGISYLYAAWLDVRNKSDPAAWIAYEKVALPAWECVVARINRSLELEGRSDRITPFPANLAVATLIERATTGSVAGVTAGSTLDTVNRLVRDDVHLTPLGVYYMGLVSYAAVYRHSPVGAWKPAEVGSDAAASLQAIALEVVASYYARQPLSDLTACQAHMRNTMCSAYFTYRDKSSQVSSCQGTFAAQNIDNPFYFNAATDGSFWYPAP